MSRSARLLMFLLLVSCIVLAGLYFGPAILAGFIKPLSAGLWLLLRIMVLSFDQAGLWAYLMLALSVLAAYRALRALVEAQPDARGESEAPDLNSSLRDVEYWRYMFAETPRDVREFGLVQRELAKLLCSAYASRERVESDFALYNGFKTRRIPLPDGVYSLIFEDMPMKSRTRLQAWLRRISGRDGAEYRGAIEAFLKYLESQMEIDDEQ